LQRTPLRATPADSFRMTGDSSLILVTEELLTIQDWSVPMDTRGFPKSLE